VRFFKAVLAALLGVSAIGIPAQAAAPKVSFVADVWADNWFQLYVNGVKVAEDPVPITTTKSFNKVTVTFTASYPLSVAILAKDYIENNSGLEYIGTPQQQIGDAGLVAQIHERVSGKLAAYTNSTWRRYVINKAPLNPECVSSSQPLADCKSSILATPSKWFATSLSTSSWKTAKEYSQQEVGVKDGYLLVKWDPKAKLIWSDSLTQDNTVIFRATFKSAISSSALFELKAPELGTSNALQVANTCDGTGTMPILTWSGNPTGTKSFLITMDTAPGPVRPGETVQTDFNHLVIYDVPASASSIGPAISIGKSGKNFKGTIGYTPPCSQGPGLKSYTFHIYALNALLGTSNLTGSAALKLAEGKILGQANLVTTYTRQ
jgi:phosphatidylethanolamine-binding protein (PEBP) family uncharacterized protein